MANLRVLVKRRKAVRNIRKITKTMELIATSRFQRALKRATEAEAFTRKIAEITADLSKNAGDVSHPLLATRPVKKSLLLVITANRGLCGGYNGSILREAMGAIRKYKTEDVPFELEGAGKRGIGFFKFQGIATQAAYTQFEDKPTFEQVDEVAEKYLQMYIKGEVDRAFGPVQGAGFVQERRFHQNEHAQGDIILAEERGRSGELAERHALVQARQDFGMNRFESHRHFEFGAAQQVAELHRRFADQRRMTFDDDPPKAPHALRNCREIFRWNRARVEEAAAVVEFDLAQGGAGDLPVLCFRTCLRPARHRR
jgi:hypothetical protein